MKIDDVICFRIRSSQSIPSKHIHNTLILYISRNNKEQVGKKKKRKLQQKKKQQVDDRGREREQLSYNHRMQENNSNMVVSRSS